MKKFILTLLLSLACLVGTAACNADAVPQSIPEERSTVSDDCPDGNCPEKNDDCPDGNCPEENNDYPDGNCPEKNDDCPDGNCPRKGEDIPIPPDRPLPPRKRANRIKPPRFPIRPVPPIAEPTL